MYWRGLIQDWVLPPLEEVPPQVKDAVFWRRGLRTPAKQRLFLEGTLADLSSLSDWPDLEAAVSLLNLAIRQKKLVFIAGDYDVDGISSSALLGWFLRKRGVPFRIRLPTRAEGYGLSEALVMEAVEAGTGLFISVDTGSRNGREVALLRAAGIPVLICDHHQIPANPDLWPAADAFINLHRSDCRASFRDLAAAGVVYRLLQAYLEAHEGGQLSDLEEAADLVAIATLADVMPLQGDNRILARVGLEKLRSAPLPGLTTLMEKANLRRETLSSRGVVFRIVPRLNAPGRLAEPDPALALLLAEAPSVLTEQIALALEQLNRLRQTLQESALEEAEQLLREAYGEEEAGWPAALVIRKAGWHKGIIGLVAAKLTEKYQRPAAVFTLDPGSGLWVGSGRSVEHVPLHVVLEEACRPHVVKGGGHAMAAGFTVREAHYEAFRRAFMEAVSVLRTQAPKTYGQIDAILEVPTLFAEDVASLTAHFEPVGPANPAPRYLLSAARLCFDKQARRWWVHALEEGGLRSFYAQLTFSALQWERQAEALCAQAEGLIVTPYRVGQAIQLKVRDLILGRLPEGQ